MGNFDDSVKVRLELYCTSFRVGAQCTTSLLNSLTYCEHLFFHQFCVRPCKLKPGIRFRCSLSSDWASRALVFSWQPCTLYSKPIGLCLKLTTKTLGKSIPGWAKPAGHPTRYLDSNTIQHYVLKGFLVLLDRSTLLFPPLYWSPLASYRPPSSCLRGLVLQSLPTATSTLWRPIKQAMLPAQPSVIRTRDGETYLVKKTAMAAWLPHNVKSMTRKLKRYSVIFGLVKSLAEILYRSQGLNLHYCQSLTNMNIL